MRKEDSWAILIGLFLLLIGLLLFYLKMPNSLKASHAGFAKSMEEEASKAPYYTLDWEQLSEQQRKLKMSNEPIGKWAKWLTDKPGSWGNNPIESFYLSAPKAAALSLPYEETADLLKGEASLQFKKAHLADSLAAQAGYQDIDLNRNAEQEISNWKSKNDRAALAAKKANKKAYSKLGGLALLACLFALLFGIGVHRIGTPIGQFIRGFLFVFALGIIAFLFGAQNNMKAIGFGYAAWAILLGLLISNTIGTPKWVKPALRTEFFIKTGLVILGAEILLSKILAIGLPGLFVAWLVTPIVLISTYWFGQKVLKIGSKSLNMTISADMSVCGVSAAVATAAACKASKEELTVAIGLSMIFTSVMMIALPAFINLVGIPEILGGAWIGGTIDATGAVVAAGAFLGDEALNVAATIKMIQNVLIGLIAFGVAIYFAKQSGTSTGTTVGLKEIWVRFPKFILGFIGASILFSIIYAGTGPDIGYSLIDQGVIATFQQKYSNLAILPGLCKYWPLHQFRRIEAAFHGWEALSALFDRAKL